MMWGLKRGNKNRGQSNPIAIVLVFGLVIGSTTVVVLVGGSAISSTQDQLDTASAENAMTQLDSQASLVALGASGRQTVDLSGTGSENYRVNDGGKMTVTVQGQSDPIIEEELGSVVYESDSGTTIAYQGGGVWRTDENGNSVMVSPPEVHYRDGTLTLPLVTVNGPSSISNSIIVSKNNSVQAYPNATNSLANPVDDGLVKITVQSKYYEAWANYFRTRTTGGVSVDDTNNEVTLKLLKQDDRTINQPVAILGGGSGSLTIQSGATVVVDNYNSSTTPPDLDSTTPPATAGNSGVTTTLDVEFSGNSKIDGNLTTAGEITKFTGSGLRVGENLRYGDGSVSSSDCSSYVGDWCNDNASIDSSSDLNNDISNTISQYQTENENSATDCVSKSTGLEYSDSSCTTDDTIELGSGSYYLKNQDLTVGKDKKLILNTTSGGVKFGIDNSNKVNINGNVTVVGDGRVNVYATDRVDISNSNSFVWNRGWDAEQFWIYCGSGCEIDVKKGTYNGVIYAPPGGGGNSGDVEIRNGALVYGAIIAGGGSTAELGQNSEVYFDENLETTSVFERPTVPSIAYLHVSVNRVNVTSK